MKKIIAFSLGVILMLGACKSSGNPSLDSADGDLRRRAVLELSRSGESAGHFKDFVSILENDTDYLVRCQAALALGKLKNPEAIPVLGKSLSDSENMYLKIDSAKALGMIKDTKALKHLHKALVDDKFPQVRRECAKSLGNIESEKSVMILIKALDDVDPGVSMNSYKALRNITKLDLPMDINSWKKKYSKQE